MTANSNQMCTDKCNGQSSADVVDSPILWRLVNCQLQIASLMFMVLDLNLSDFLLYIWDIS